MPIKENMLSNRHWMVACSVLTVALMFLANDQLQRVATGQLFLFTMPWDAAPTHVELVDAKLSVAETQTAAVFAVAAIGLAVMMTGPAVLKTVRQQTLVSRILLLGFTIAVLADMLSTVWFFHAQGIDFEFHPAIRLFGYAYGRTIGPIAGKLIQAGGIIYVAVLLKGRASFLIYLTSAVYLAASIYNVSQTLAALSP